MGQELNQHCIFQMHASTLKPRMEPRSVGTPCAFGGHACQHQNPKESGKHNARQLHLALKSGSHELHRAPPAIVMDESNENPASHPPRLRNQDGYYHSKFTKLQFLSPRTLLSTLSWSVNTVLYILSHADLDLKKSRCHHPILENRWNGDSCVQTAFLYW